MITLNLIKPIKEYLDSLPPASVNNARKMIRADLAKAEKMNPMSAAKFLNEKYGWGLDPDRTAFDYGGEPNNQE